MRYSYTIANKRGIVSEGTLTEEHYKEALKHDTIIPINEWKTEYNESTLYAKRYKIKNTDEQLFLWKEVFKVCK